jgi:transposase-like protein
MPKTKDVPRKPLPAGIGKVLKRLHYPLDVIVLCVRWYVAYSVSLRNLEEMMAERGIEVDRSSVPRWVIKLVPLFEKAFRRHKRPVGKSWRMDETYVKVKGQWKYLYRAVDRQGNTVDFLCAPIVTRPLRAATSRRRLTRMVSPKRLPWIRAAPIWPRSKRSTPSGRHRSRSARTST